MNRTETVGRFVGAQNSTACRCIHHSGDVIDLDSLSIEQQPVERQLILFVMLWSCGRGRRGLVSVGMKTTPFAFFSFVRQQRCDNSVFRVYSEIMNIRKVVKR